MCGVLSGVWGVCCVCGVCNVRRVHLQWAGHGVHTVVHSVFTMYRRFLLVSQTQAQAPCTQYAVCGMRYAACDKQKEEKTCKCVLALPYVHIRMQMLQSGSLKLRFHMQHGNVNTHVAWGMNTHAIF